MWEIINRHTYGIKDNKNIDLCDIICDDLESLPTKQDIIDNNIAFGSFCYVISEKEFYVLNSGGEWK